MQNDLIRPISLALIACILMTAGCDSPTVTPAPKTAFTYLFLGHIYQWHSPHEFNRIDHRLEGHDYGQYDAILLGGDLCSEASKYKSTISYLDQLFDLGSPTTMWSVGNHDIRNGNTHWIEAYTGRPLFYTSTLHGITWIVLNTVFDDIPDLANPCELKARQIEMLNETLDTLTSASHVVLLMHNVVWGDVEPGMNTQEAANVNRPGQNLVCDSIVRFASHVYPKLSALSQSGIGCHVISGDGGQYAKTYAYETMEGVQFFISGINNSVDTAIFQTQRPFDLRPDSVLMLHHDMAQRTLQFEFVSLTVLTD